MTSHRSDEERCWLGGSHPHCACLRLQRPNVRHCLTFGLYGLRAAIDNNTSLTGADLGLNFLQPGRNFPKAGLDPLHLGFQGAPFSGKNQTSVALTKTGGPDLSFEDVHLWPSHAVADQATRASGFEVRRRQGDELERCCIGPRQVLFG